MWDNGQKVEERTKIGERERWRDKEIVKRLDTEREKKRGRKKKSGEATAFTVRERE